MTIPELVTPFRLYWDPVADLAVQPNFAGICREIVALKFLAVDVTDSGSTFSSVSRQILDYLAGAPLRLTVTVSGQAFSGMSRERSDLSGCAMLLVQARSLTELSSITADMDRYRNDRQIGISWQMHEATASDLPEVVASCAKHGIKQLVIPMQRLACGTAPFILEQAALTQLAGKLAEIPSLAGVSATIHDPFLWRAFHNDTPFPEGRCQAANTMLYLAADGRVYPCPEMPVDLGSVLNESLSMIVKGEKRQKVRQRIRELPAGCHCCSVAVACFGGCRGRGLVATGGWDGADPGCR
ncbi:MAG TPA: SPASM domain-containing protein [Geobacteraceae bacterium]